MCFEGSTDDDFAEFLSAHSIAPPLKVAFGTLWPKQDFYPLHLRAEVLEEAAALVERQGVSLPSIHLHVHDCERILLEWHDAFQDSPLLVTGALARDRVEEFGRTVGANEVARGAGEFERKDPS